MKASVIATVTLATVSSVRAEDPLPSWNDGPTKQAIVRFVADVATEGGPHFVPPAERIAVFDNDGTLWCEQPMYPQMAFNMERVREEAAKHPQWREQQPFKAVLENDLKAVAASSVHGLVEMTAAPNAGLTTEEFSELARKWQEKSRHPRFNRPYTECVFQPMVELLAYLRAKGVKTWIISGGSVEFMRPWTERIYGIVPEQVVGSRVKLKHEVRGGKPVLVREAEIDLINDKAEKVVSIERFIGRRPIMAFGNSDGDLPMLQWAAAGDGRRFAAYIHHTDADREYAYDRDAWYGRLDKGLEEAKKNGWAVVDIRNDWKRVFAFETPQQRWWEERRG